jgi:SEC-C motif-containing protein
MDPVTTGSVFGSFLGDDGEVGLCTCGNLKPLDACCGPLLAGTREARTAEELARARYTAFASGDRPFLIRTWHSSSRPKSVRELPPPDVVEWLGFSVLSVKDGGPDDDVGTVEFRARMMAGRQMTGMQENAQFVKEDGQWFYLGALEED